MAANEVLNESQHVLTTAVPSPVVVGINPMLAKHIEEQEATLVAELASGNETKMSTSVPGAVVTVQRLAIEEVAAADGRYLIQAEGSAAAASVPAELLAELGGEMIVVITAFTDSASSNQSVSDSAGIEALGLVSVKVSSASSPGNTVHVKNLLNRVQIQLTVNASSGAECVFWDEASLLWSSAGVEATSPGPSGELVCASTHLTLFAAVWRGVKDTFVCSQVVLFNRKSLREVLSTDWLDRIDAKLLWIL